MRPEKSYPVQNVGAFVGAFENGFLNIFIFQRTRSSVRVSPSHTVKINRFRAVIFLSNAVQCHKPNPITTGLSGRLPSCLPLPNCLIPPIAVQLSKAKKWGYIWGI